MVCPSVFRHFIQTFSELAFVLTILFMQLCLSCQKRKYVRMHDQIGHKLPAIEIVCTSTGVISILLERMCLKPVSETFYNAQGLR
jgi:hypothetical protein